MIVNVGVYELVRHPMYGGLVMFGLGYSVLLESTERLFLSVVLFFLLDAKANKEENMLKQLHPQVYMDPLLS